MRTFTLQEAQSLLPVIESLVRRAKAALEKSQKFESDMQELTQRIHFNGGTFVDVAVVARRRAERDVAVREAKDTLAEMDAIGVQVKDIHTGLLDFPCQLDGQIVLLCWRLGETEIGFWHTMDGGFAGRQPVDERFSKSKRDRLN